MVSNYENGQFQFVPVHGPHVLKDKAAIRSARSHAVKQALDNKRKHQQQSRQNFRMTTTSTKSNHKSRTPSIKKHRTVLPVLSLFSLDASALDPFQSLAVDSARLQTLLRHGM
jgi:hypothetical protein